MRVETEKARDEAEQHGYDVGVAKTEDTLQAQIPAVCRIYCAQTWEEALNRAGVEASSKLRRLGNVYFPPTIQALDLPSQDFQQALASTTMPVEGASKDKEETIPIEADKPANKTSKLQIKLKQ